MATSRPAGEIAFSDHGGKMVFCLCQALTKKLWTPLCVCVHVSNYFNEWRFLVFSFHVCISLTKR